MDHPLLKKAIVSVLQDIVKGEISEPTMGLCSGVSEQLDEYFESSESMANAAIELWDSIQDGLYMKWPKYSGYIVYPVPATAKQEVEYEHMDTYYVSSANYAYKEQEFKYGGEYGELRLELAQFIINELKVEINHR